MGLKCKKMHLNHSVKCILITGLPDSLNKQSLLSYAIKDSLLKEWSAAKQWEWEKGEAQEAGTLARQPSSNRSKSGPGPQLSITGPALPNVNVESLHYLGFFFERLSWAGVNSYRFGGILDFHEIGQPEKP